MKLPPMPKKWLDALYDAVPSMREYPPDGGAIHEFGAGYGYDEAEEWREWAETAATAIDACNEELAALRAFVREVANQDPAQPTGQRQSNKERAEDLCEAWGITS